LVQDAVSALGTQPPASADRTAQQRYISCADSSHIFSFQWYVLGASPEVRCAIIAISTLHHMRVMFAGSAKHSSVHSRTRLARFTTWAVWAAESAVRLFLYSVIAGRWSAEAPRRFETTDVISAPSKDFANTGHCRLTRCETSLRRLTNLTIVLLCDFAVRTRSYRRIRSRACHGTGNGKASTPRLYSVASCRRAERFARNRAWWKLPIFCMIVPAVPAAEISKVSKRQFAIDKHQVAR